VNLATTLSSEVINFCNLPCMVLKFVVVLCSGHYINKLYGQYPKLHVHFLILQNTMVAPVLVLYNRGTEEVNDSL